MRRNLLLVPAALLAGCSDRPSSAAMATMLQRDAALPACPGADPEFQLRDPGGGWQGGALMMTVRLPERCKALWRTELRNAQTLDCRASGPALRCSRADRRGGVEIDMREHDTAKVYLWTIT